MIYTKMTKKAMLFAYNAHKDQVDKGETPYIFHPFHLAEQMDSEEAVVIALLHDVVEDTDLTFDDIMEQGFPETVIAALRLLSHSDDDDYDTYIRKIKESNNSHAKAVKLADLKHNCDLSRWDSINEEIMRRVEKYKKAMITLSMPEGQ